MGRYDMRIIAGECRGRALLPPISDATRPITDRAKQSLFDILAPLIPDAIVYDCFAGTGSMGLECLSRSAKQAVFFERDRTAVQILRKNIESLGLSERSRVMSGDLFAWFTSTTPCSAEAGHTALVFLDPPYRFLKEQSKALQNLARQLVQHHLQPQATVVFRHDVADSLELGGLTRYDQRKYGQMMIELLRPST